MTTPRFDPAAPDFVSVVIPSYNRARILPRAMRSVLAQTHGNLELIIADDCSSDDTEAVVRAAAEKDPRVVYARRDRNGGAGAGRNLGIQTARGALIAFQDSDDEWLLDKLERQVAVMLAHPEYGATFGVKLIHGHDDDYNYGPGLTSVAPDRRRPAVSGDMTAQIMAGNLISPQTLMLRTAIARELGGFDERLRNNEDWEFMLRLAQRTAIHHLPEPVAVAFVQADSIHTNPRNSARSFLRILRKHRALFADRPDLLAGFFFRAGRYLQRIGRPRAAALCMRRALKLARPGRAMLRPAAGLASALLAARKS